MGRKTFEAIEDLSFDINSGELVSVVGKTGCGKSTTLSIILGVEKPTGGRVSIDGSEPYNDFDSFRGKLSAVYQTDRLLPWRTALENARFGLEILQFGKKEQLDRAGYWLDKLGLAGFDNAYPHELSGGMRQRVGIARAFCVDPEILLCDEAFGHLDEVTAIKLRADFLELVRETRKTSVFITHDIEEAVDLGERVLVLGNSARLLADVQLPADIKNNPAKRGELKTRIIKAIETNEPAD